MTFVLSFIRIPFVEIVGWVFWWYGRGLVQVLSWWRNESRELEDHIHWKQWAKALFVPMYGQRDWKGRLISLFMRLVMLVYKTVWVLVWSVFHLILILAYLVFPVLSLSMAFIALSYWLYD